MNYKVFTSEETLIIKGAQFISHDGDELIFRDSDSAIIAIINKVEYIAILKQ